MNQASDMADPADREAAGSATTHQECSIDGCDDPAKKRGWCLCHYGRWYRHGSPHVVLKKASRRPRADRKPCSRSGCDRDAVTRELCTAHYGRLRRRERAEQLKPVPKSRLCVSCGALADCSGLARWCRPCFHVWADADRAKRLGVLSSAARIRAYTGSTR